MSGLAEFVWLERLERDDLRRYQQAAHDLQAHPGWEMLQQVLGRAQQRAVNDMVTGGPHEQAHYAERAGFIRALKMAFDAPAAVEQIATRRFDAEQRNAEQAEQQRRAK